MCPKMSVTQDLKAGDLVMLDWNRPEEEVPMIMLWHKEKWCSQILKDFMAMSEKVMARESMGHQILEE